MDDNDPKKPSEAISASNASEDGSDPSVPSLGVRRKLKTFCRRRKGTKDTMKKRKSPWSFKFGTKGRDCATIETSGNYEACVCTVYRRTDCNPRVVDTDSSEISANMTSTNTPPDSKSSEFELPLSNATDDKLTLDSLEPSNESESPGSDSACSSNISADLWEFEGPLMTNDEPGSSKMNSDLLPVVCPQDGLSAYHRCDRHSNSNLELGIANNKTEETVAAATSSAQSSASTSTAAQPEGAQAAIDFDVLDLAKFNPDEYPMEDWDERARIQRAKEMEEGVDPPPGYKPRQKGQSQELRISELALYLQNHLLMENGTPATEHNTDTVRLSRDVLAVLKELTLASLFQSSVHTQVDYIHCLVPDLLDITNCSCYWGKMDRYEAEKLLENKPEGTFLLRDSAQEEFLFSVSFQRYGKTLHARIEQWNHKFSFDSHDPGVFSSNTVCGLIEHYKDPSCCMYFDPMLTIPLHRKFPFSLQHLCRATICNNVTYDSINYLQLPKSVKSCLKEYHYKQRVKVRRFDY